MVVHGMTSSQLPRNIRHCDLPPLAQSTSAAPISTDGLIYTSASNPSIPPFTSTRTLLKTNTLSSHNNGHQQPRQGHRLADPDGRQHWHWRGQAQGPRRPGRDWEAVYWYVP